MNITASSALIVGNIIVNASMQIIQAGVEYALSPTMSMSQDALVAVSPQYNVQLTGLSPNTIYYYRAFVIAGSSRCVGEIRSFTTSGAAVPLVITGDPFDVLDTTATIRNSSYTNLPLPPTEVGIEYSLFPNLSGSISTAAAQAITPFDVPLSNLLPITTYYYRAYAVSGGVRYYGEIKSFRTFILIEIFNGVPTEITSTSVLLAGNVFEVHSTGAVLMEIGVEYSTDPTFAVKTRVSAPLPSPTGGLFSLQLTGLTPNTVYHYRVYGIVNAQDLYGLGDVFQTLA